MFSPRARHSLIPQLYFTWRIIRSFNPSSTLRLFYSSPMATRTLLPRFLLPKLSWKQVDPIASREFRCLKSDFYNANKTAARPHHSNSFRGPQSENRAIYRPSIIEQSRSVHRRRQIWQSARQFSTSPASSRDHHFDTLKFVQRLRSEGFSEDQAKAMMLVLSDVIEESIQNLTRTMVLKEGR